MNTDNLLLRALTNLFGQDTLVYIIFTFVFLVIQKRIKQNLVKINISERWSIFLSAWLSVILLFLTSLLFKNIAQIFREKRYGTDPGINIEVGLGQFIGMLLVSSITIALGFSIYQHLRKRFISAVPNINKQMLLDGLSLFILANLSLLCSSIVVTLYECFFTATLDIKTLMILPSILTSLAIWISPVIACTFVFVLFNYFQYINNLKDQRKELKIVRLQQELAQSQLAALSAKINPHFLYNALNSIAGLSATDGLKTRNMAIALAKLFRYNINKEESNYTSITDEIEMVKIYLEIEKIRFEEKLQYTIAIPTDIEQESIPKHLLQPLVENAIKHGTGPDGITISIAIEKRGQQIVISIGDNGKPFDTDFTPGYGIKSLYDKLDLLTNGNYEIAFLTTPKTVQITLGKYHKLA